MGEVIQTILISFCFSLISYFFAVKQSKSTLKEELANTKKETLYEIKRQAILDALDFCDDYLSYLDWNSSVTPVRKELDKNMLTLRSREIYNRLFVTCDQSDLCRLFMQFNFGSTNKLAIYDRFRMCCREELGLDKIISDKENVFISVISTHALDVPACADCQTENIG